MSGIHREIAPTIAILPPLPPESANTDGDDRGAYLPSPVALVPPRSPTPVTARIDPVPGVGFDTADYASAATTTANSDLLPDLQSTSARLSSNWDPDARSNRCSACQSPFDAIFKRKHHCRLCGHLFCHDCSNTRSLIPPSALVLRDSGGTGAGAPGGGPSFAPPGDGDASVTYVGSSSGVSGGDDDTLLYGRGLEQRILKARHPQRVCHSCREQLAPLQEELCMRNSNAMRYNYIDEGDDLRRLCNSPLAFTLGHEVRKAAYALGNLLPGKRESRRSGFVPSLSSDSSMQYSYPPPEADPCHIPTNGASCPAFDPTLRNLDRMHIPARLLRRARGVAVVTSAKGGLGFAGFEFGTGLVVARRCRPEDDVAGDPDAWSAPSAIGIAGFAWGALVGAQVSDHIFLLMTDDAVRLFASDGGRSIQLGADVGVAVGPLGRSAEADIGATSGLSRSLDGHSHRAGIAMAPVYTYSLSKGLYAGVSLDGRVLMTRDRVNEKFYGRAVSAHELLSGLVPTPPAAQPLYDALRRCRVYGGGEGEGTGASGASPSGVGGVVDGHSAVAESSRGGGGGGLMERWSHATGAGLPVSSPSSRYSTGPNPYNLSGREGFSGY